MQTKVKRLDSIVLTNANPQNTGKLDDLQGGDTTMRMMHVLYRMHDELVKRVKNV